MSRLVRGCAWLVAVALVASVAHVRVVRLVPEAEEEFFADPLPTDLEREEESAIDWDAALNELRRMDRQTTEFYTTDQSVLEDPPLPSPPPHWWTPDRLPPLVEFPPSPVFVARNSGSDRPPRAGLIGRSDRARPGFHFPLGGAPWSQAAVDRALAWLAREQTNDGSWSFDGTARGDKAAATGAALLPFLGTGCTHRTSKYAKVVGSGVEWLLDDQQPDGSFGTAPTITGHALATIALAECYGLTKDGNLVRSPTFAALNFLRGSQNADGGWGDRRGEKSDSAATGWALQALHAGCAAKLIDADAGVFEKAAAFLAAPATDPAGVLARIHAGRRVAEAKFIRPGGVDARYVYHATWVMFLVGGDDWATWNTGPGPRNTRYGGVRDEVEGLQVQKNGPGYGSWEPDESVGREWGRLGTTVLATLTLEVYYRYPRE